MKKFIVAAVATVATTGSMLVTAPSASAAPLVTGGLVNVTVTDVQVIDDVTVILEDVNVVTLGAALGIAANVCDVGVNVLAQQLKSGGATCTSDATGQTVDVSRL